MFYRDTTSRCSPRRGPRASRRWSRGPQPPRRMPPNLVRRRGPGGAVIGGLLGATALLLDRCGPAVENGDGLSLGIALVALVSIAGAARGTVRARRPPR